MTERIDSGRRPVVIPAHPVWCPESGKASQYATVHPDHLHRGDAWHAELQSFEVGFSVGLVQYDEQCSDGKREVGTPRLEVCVEHRACRDDVQFEMTLREARQLQRVIGEGIRQLVQVRDGAAEHDAASWALGWTPVSR